MNRDTLCGLCPMSSLVTPSQVCRVSNSVPGVDVLVVSKFALSESGRAEMDSYLDQAGVSSSRGYASSIKCHTYDRQPTKGDVKACAPYLAGEIERIQPKRILALGTEPLLSLTGKSGIMKYRAIEVGNVFPTISPSMVKRNPGLRTGFIADLRYFARLDSPEAPSGLLPDRIRATMTGKGLKALMASLETADGAAFDIETNGFDEFLSTSKIVSISVTLWRGEEFECWAVPLYHPESPFKKIWKKVLKLLGSVLVKVPVIVGHNGKFDSRWLHEFGVMIQLTFDTMLALHLLNENEPKGLKPAAQAHLGAKPWGIDTHDLLNEPLRKVLRYNGLDTWHTAKLAHLLMAQLEEQPRLKQLMTLLMVPASNVLTDVERQGIWVDRERLNERAAVAVSTLEAIETKLRNYVPDPSVWPTNIKDVNFNASNFARWWLFTHLGYPVLARGKTKENGNAGDPSMAESVIGKLQEQYPDDEVPTLLLERVKWNKFVTSFFTPYLEQIDENDHIHTTFKLTGTVTGRLSSGKGDDEKVTSKVQNRGVNLQQVPRDKFVRGIFGAKPGHVFVECDYSQVELRLAAFIAQEQNMLALYNLGLDIHTRMAIKMTGLSEAAVQGEPRKKAKAVNFGFLYGMGAMTFIETAWSNYAVKVSDKEAKAFRLAFFTEFPGLPAWHNRQRRLASKYGRVESPLGRVRHLPDIYSADANVRNEAQRQAINSPVQSFASDMAVWSMVILDKVFRKKKIRARCIGLVHDAVNYEIHEDDVARAVPLIRKVMENLPLERYFGFALNVPIVADAKIGLHWGDSKEVPPENSGTVSGMRQWLNDHNKELL